MGDRPRRVDRYRLSSTTTVTDYRDMEDAEDRARIIKFLRERFEERYFSQLSQITKPNGFFTMSICAPLVEAFQAFRSGWKDITKKREKPYKEFFKDHPEFGVPADRSKELYDAIRSGLSHNAETYNGWRIVGPRKAGAPVNFKAKTIDAAGFLRLLKDSFDRYFEMLGKSKWNDDKTWGKLRNRMNGLIQMCEGGPVPDDEDTALLNAEKAD